jgi:anti-sigma-K factor RskA
VLRQISTVRPLPPVTGRTGSSADAAADQPAPLEAPATVTPLESRRRKVKPMTWLVAAAAAAVLLIGGIVWSPWDNGGTQQPPLSITEQVIRAKDAQRFEKDIDGARATIVRSPSLGRAVIIADNMPAAPEGKDFQIWYQDPNGAMHSAGVMPHEAKPTVSMVLDGDASKYNGVGITVEPAGGSPEPTSPPIALIEFS